MEPCTNHCKNRVPKRSKTWKTFGACSPGLGKLVVVIALTAYGCFPPMAVGGLTNPFFVLEDGLGPQTESLGSKVALAKKIGFDGLEFVICGGAPLPPETMALWQMYGVNVLEVYGQTEEAGGIIAGQRGQFPRPGNVGAAPDGWDVRLADDGEVLVRSPDLLECYWHNEDATRAVKQEDGWLRTGDIGEWTAGGLRLIDRARDFIVTSGGKTISPSFIENVLRASPYISEAVVFGHGRKYLTALVEIDFDMVSDWARRNDIAYTGFTNLAEKPQVVC